MSHPRHGLGRLETTKDTLQVVAESGATHTGRIAVIVAVAVRDVVRELGDWATDVFEMREAARRANADPRRELGERSASARERNLPGDLA